MRAGEEAGERVEEKGGKRRKSRGGRVGEGSYGRAPINRAPINRDTKMVIARASECFQK